VAAVKAKLSNDDLRRLQVALGYLLVESTPGLRIDGLPVTNVAARVANPNAILVRLGPRINGNTAAGVIENLRIKLDAEISETEARLPNAESVLGSVEISAPSYYWKRSGYLEQPVIEFTVRNGGTSPISRVYFSSALVSPNRAIPWARAEFVQTFKGGLEPREKQQITIQPRAGEWRDPQLKYLPNAELKVAVLNFEDANQERVIAVDKDGLELKRRVRAALQ
jgi:hypothetical protein